MAFRPAEPENFCIIAHKGDAFAWVDGLRTEVAGFDPRLVSPEPIYSMISWHTHLMMLVLRLLASVECLEVDLNKDSSSLQVLYSVKFPNGRWQNSWLTAAKPSTLPRERWTSIFLSIVPCFNLIKHLYYLSAQQALRIYLWRSTHGGSTCDRRRGSSSGVLRTCKAVGLSSVRLDIQSMAANMTLGSRGLGSVKTIPWRHQRGRTSFLQRRL